MPIVGAHVSAAGELSLSLERAQNIGADCVQIFITPPQQWAQNSYTQEEFTNFKNKAAELKIGPNFIHGVYLINLGTDKPEQLQKSIAWLQYARKIASEAGIQGIIFHIGSHSKRGFEAVIDQVVKSLKETLKDELATELILENSAGAGGSIGGKFSELGEILKRVNDPRLKVCLDTCHTFVAGYDIKTLAGLRGTIEEFDTEIGLPNLAAFHANDCKFEMGSHKDRHENIGDGFLGKESFENILRHPAFKEIPFILEVPGFSGTGPDKENIDILKSLI